MIKVKISDGFPTGANIRQTPGGRGQWGDYQFFFNEDIEECDYWVVHDRMVKAETTNCPPQNTLFIAYEPPSLKPYNPDFMAQFNRVAGPDATMAHPDKITTQPSVPWFVGTFKKTGQKIEFTKGYDELKTISEPVKTHLLSSITSHLTWSPSHKKRYDFVIQLKERLGDRFDLFGRGINDLNDKWDGIAPYKYHLAIENSRDQDYWTEKLADAFLAGAYPIYYGCPNITDYFPAEALTVIDINNFEEAVAIIEQTINSNRYEEALPKIQEARHLILDYYNLFPTLTRLCPPERANLPKERLTIYPEEHFWDDAEWARNLKAERAYFRSHIGLQDRLLDRQNEDFQEYAAQLKAAAQRAEEYARSLELELEKYRVEYARLTEAYNQHEKEARQYVESLLQALHPSKQS